MKITKKQKEIINGTITPERLKELCEIIEYKMTSFVSDCAIEENHVAWMANDITKQEIADAFVSIIGDGIALGELDASLHAFITPKALSKDAELCMVLHVLSVILPQKVYGVLNEEANKLASKIGKIQEMLEDIE